MSAEKPKPLDYAPPTLAGMMPPVPRWLWWVRLFLLTVAAAFVLLVVAAVALVIAALLDRP